jgi:hypothetical protein
MNRNSLWPMKALRFSKWVSWDDRSALDGLKYPGVYALAISNKSVAGQDYAWLKNIRYFGMTRSEAGLKGRLSQFNNTLRDKRGPGHGGAARFRYDYEDGEELAKRLYVAVCPFRCNAPRVIPDDLLVLGRIAMAEYVAFAEYAKRYGKLPKYNDKKSSPKRPRSDL